MTRVCGKHLSYSDTEKTDWEHFDSLTCDGLIAADGNVVAAPVLKYNLPTSCRCRLPPVCHLPFCVIYPMCVITYSTPLLLVSSNPVCHLPLCVLCVIVMVYTSKYLLAFAVLLVMSAFNITMWSGLAMCLRISA